MGKSSNATQSSVPAPSISLVTPNKLKSKVAVPPRKQNGTIKVHVTPTKNETGILCASVLNSFCCREFLNALRGQNGIFNRLISLVNLTLALELCEGQNEFQITRRAEELEVSTKEITDVLDYFFANNYGIFSFCNVVRFSDNDAAQNFFRELDNFNGTTFNDKTVQIVYHPPMFTTRANDFYVDAVLDHLCPTHGNNEDNNGQQIVQNGYLGYF